VSQITTADNLGSDVGAFGSVRGVQARLGRTQGGRRSYVGRRIALAPAARVAAALVAAALFAAGLSCEARPGTGDTCAGYQDGISGGTYKLVLTVTDDGFEPIILKAQDNATVTLTLANEGTRPHDFVVDCIPTPNGEGCPSMSCFPDEANIGPLEPGASATTTFVAPHPEGIYVFRSDLPGDTQTGQFVVQ
jgi:hypothetical protein